MIINKLFNSLHLIYNHPLNKGRRFEAIKRWAKWQIGSRLVPGPVAVTFVNDIQLLVLPGMTGATGNIYTGLLEFQDMSFVLHFLRKEDLFVDIGANIGAYTLLAGGGVGARCIAVEPITTTYRHLQKNVALNELQNNVTLLNIGVGCKDGIIRFTAGLDTENRALKDGESGIDNTEEVVVTTLDKIVGVSKPRLMKIDVEGFESNVIAGGFETMTSESLEVVLIELNGLGGQYGFDEKSVHLKMLEYGFSPYEYLPFERSLAPAKGLNPIGNTLYIKNIESVQNRVTTAPFFNVLNQSI